MDADITALLARARGGDENAYSAVVVELYEQLKRMARLQRRRAGGATLETTGLVHEGYLRIREWSRQVPGDRGHFLRLAATVMRQVLCEHARRRLAQKRGGGAAPVDLNEDMVAELAEAEQFVALDDALKDLKHSHPALAQVIECRFFLGLSEQETAEAMDTSLRSVQRYWSQARAHLTGELS